MEKWDVEVQQAMLSDEKEAIKKIKEAYKKALDDVNAKIQELQNQILQLTMAGNTDEATQSMIQSKVYQKQYQEAIKQQISAILDNVTSSNYETINEYLKKSYEDGYIGTMYSLHNQGIPLIMPIDQEEVARAIVHDTKLSDTLYKTLGINTNELKKSIRSELSRGISQGYSYNDIARNISNAMNVDINKTIRIARTEGHRIQNQSAMDSAKKAKDIGADVVKQWDSALDRKTRPHHQQLDGQIRELDEPFEVDGHKAQAPGKFGIASEDINCRCAMLTRARSALDEDELNTLKERAKYYGLDKTDSFNDFKKKYLQLHGNLDTPKDSMNYSVRKARKELSKADISSVRKADETTVKIYSKVFKGYQPSLLKMGSDSEMTMTRIMNKDGTLKYVRSVSNIAIPAGQDHVDIGNDMLGNSLHERAHDVVTQLALKRAGITDENHVTIIQDRLFQEEKQKIQMGVYIYCFSDESFEEIQEIVNKQISEYALHDGHEFISESFVQCLGAEKPSELSKKVYDYLVKEWNRK